MTAPAIRRFEGDVKRLKASRTELKHDQKDIKKDRKELAADQKAKVTLGQTRDTQLASIAQARADAIATMDPADPALAQILSNLDSDQLRVTEQFGVKIANKGKEITHDRKVIHHDVMEIRHDKKAIHNRLHTAREHLKPAELQANTVRGTNRMRHAVGAKAIDHLVGDTRTVAGCARLLLNSPNVSFWTGLSTGSDEKNLKLLATHHRAKVEGTNTNIRSAMPKLKMMQALVEMSRRGHIQINALTGGTHSVGSNHYLGTAVDLDLPNAGMIVDVADNFGGHRNNESNHIHLDF